jgi:hypothetical protein
MPMSDEQVREFHEKFGERLRDDSYRQDYWTNWANERVAAEKAKRAKICNRLRDILIEFEDTEP